MGTWWQPFNSVNEIYRNAEVRRVEVGSSFFMQFMPNGSRADRFAKMCIFIPYPFWLELGLGAR